ncbi:hypothetical protein QR680_003842 [Steinernema hermaphroditum]|uniref:Uncharacterized protein n=1 Tax=Steinernema hermaphroditum TaxID=289476 RepID=A0AA39LSN8_9BILA|nr:hypothetical protein QR680_003842 [Steinernema hermaphroditum]
MKTLFVVLLILGFVFVNSSPVVKDYDNFDIPVDVQAHGINADSDVENESAPECSPEPCPTRPRKILIRFG